MIFNYTFGIQEVDKEKVNIYERIAVRAVVLRGNNLLLVHNNKGDYKFAGGGANKKESHEETIKREVREETGYIVENVKDLRGTCVERRQDAFKENAIFEMTSYYYLCQVSDSKTVQQLDDYESDMDFQPVWISLEEAISSNEELLKKNDDVNHWVYRDTCVLKALRQFF